MKHTIEVTSRELGVISWALAELYDIQKTYGTDDAENEHDIIRDLGDRIFELFHQPSVLEDAIAEREAANANKG